MAAEPCDRVCAPQHRCFPPLPTLCLLCKGTDTSACVNTCGAVHDKAHATCTRPKGHDGDHANSQGYWMAGGQ